jgi:AraC-like DNA-binding protein
MVLVDKTMVKHLPSRPIAGGTNDGVRPVRYSYWRTGYGSSFPLQPDFWVAQAGEYHCKPGYMTGDFEHTNRTQIFYHLEGEAKFEYPGRTVLVSRGDLLIVPVGCTFTYRAEPGMKHHWFALAGELPRVFRDGGVRVLSLGYDAKIEAILVEMREILILHKPGYSLKAVGVFYELMARVEEISGTSSAPESTYPEAVRNAIIFLRENYDVPYNAKETAAAVGLSQSHLRALFEKWLGESPRQFHTRYRIDQAKRLLSEQRLPVFEVAFHVGFTDARHFSRVFKKFTGITPSRYVAQDVS